MGDVVISVKNVSKCFKRYARPVDRLKEILLPGKSHAEEFWAVRDISFEVQRGETLGLVGRNGSGKSTLLQMIAGTLQPTTGDISVKGRISALLELGSGFNPEFTGRQNVFFNGQLMGLSQAAIEEKFEDIAGFADIGDFIDQPVKTYSSGMFVRLAFAVAVHVNPEVLIVDEALAVGDVVFQHRCMRRMRAMMDSGVTTLFVSHDSGAIKTLCNAAIMIHDGKVYTQGSPNIVISEYMKLLTNLELNTHPEPPHVAELASESHASGAEGALSEVGTPDAVRRGSRRALIESVKLLNRFGEDDGESPIFGFDETVTLVVNVVAQAHLKGCMVGFFVCDKNGNELIGSNTFEEGVSIDPLSPGEPLEVRFQFKLPLRTGSYNVTVAVAENYESLTLDWIDNAIVFQVLPPDTGKIIYALVDHPLTVEVKSSGSGNLSMQNRSAHY